MIIAIPASFVVERDQKQACLVQIGQHIGGLRLTGDRFAQRVLHSVENRGLHQKQLHWLELSEQHIIDQVIENVSLRAGKASD